MKQELLYWINNIIPYQSRAIEFQTIILSSEKTRILAYHGNRLLQKQYSFQQIHIIACFPEYKLPKTFFISMGSKIHKLLT